MDENEIFEDRPASDAQEPEFHREAIPEYHCAALSGPQQKKTKKRKTGGIRFVAAAL